MASADPGDAPNPLLLLNAGTITPMPFIPRPPKTPPIPCPVRRAVESSALPQRRQSTVAALLLAVAPIGCAALDATNDVSRAATSVETRSGLTPHWTAPWDELSPAWDGTSPLSSDAAVIAALQNNRELRRNVQSIVATRADFVQAHLLPNPVISIALGFPIDGGGGAPAAVSVLQQLAWLWQRPTRIDAAEADLQHQVLAVSNAALDLVAQVRTSHADVVYAERGVQLQTRNCDLIARGRHLVQRKFDVGQATRLDLNRQDLDLLQARAELVKRQATLQRAKRMLLELIGRADHPVAWTSDNHVINPAESTAAFDEAGLMPVADQLRLDIAAAQTRLRAAEHRRKLAQLGALPDINAGASYDRNFSNREAVFARATVTPKLFDDNSARIARAESELEMTRIEADRVRQQAQRELRTAWIDLHSAMQLIREQQRQIVALADENVSLAQDAFKAGTIDLTVLLEAQRRQTAARADLNDLRALAARHYFQLERAAGGTLDPHTIAEIRAGHNDPQPNDTIEEHGS